MKNSKPYGKYYLTIFFFFLIFLIGINSSPYQTLDLFFNFFKQIVNKTDNQNENELVTMNGIKKKYPDSMYLKSQFINLNGTVARNLKMQGYYSQIGILVTDEQYIVGTYSATTTDYEYTQIINFWKYLKENNINLLYVNAPTKYLKDSFIANEFGLASYSNQNADTFLKRISDAGINCIDLRDNVILDGIDINDMFYRTDHHWTTKSGLWATKIVSQALNDYCDYQIDTSIFNNSNYTFTKYNNCWLGEQGRKLSVSYVGLDDYTLIKPNFDTSFTLTTVVGTNEGSFDIMIDETRFSNETNYYDTPSYHYAYLPNMNLSVVHNNNVPKGKVLVLADSFSQVVIPFLSLGVSDVTTLVLRSFDGSVRDYIDANEFDTVIILYTQLMIGSHDNPNSANYKMFTFE